MRCKKCIASINIATTHYLFRLQKFRSHSIQVRKQENKNPKHFRHAHWLPELNFKAEWIYILANRLPESCCRFFSSILIQTLKLRLSTAHWSSIWMRGILTHKYFTSDENQFVPFFSFAMFCVSRSSRLAYRRILSFVKLSHCRSAACLYVGFSIFCTHFNEEIKERKINKNLNERNAHWINVFASFTDY